MGKTQTRRTKGFGAVRNKVTSEIVSQPVYCPISGETIAAKSWGVPETDREARQTRAAAKRYSRRRARSLENAATLKLINKEDE